MMTDQLGRDSHVVPDMLIGETAVTAMVGAPLGAVDIADWLLNLPDAEYQRCAPGQHIAAGFTVTDDGIPMSINVEEVGLLCVQHYVAEVHEPNHCRMVSNTDLRMPDGWTKIFVVWDLRVEAVDDATCRLTNTVIVRPTEEFLDHLVQGGVSFDEVAARQRVEIVAHNELETPLFADSIARKALTGRMAA